VLFMGVPTYEEKTAGFNPAAENLTSALVGIARTMPSDRDSPRMFGLWCELDDRRRRMGVLAPALAQMSPLGSCHRIAPAA
jgi:hypothetical protein